MEPIKMDKRGILIGLALCVCGCEHMSHTDRGLVGGGLLGTGAGAVIGGLAGDPLAGAAIGAATGLAAGGLAGAAADRAEARADARAQAMANAQLNPPVPMHEVIRLAQQHIHDQVIIDHIRATGSTYNLTAADIEFLAQQGVSQRVIQEMVNRRARVVGPPPVYVAPPPPVSVGVGVGFSNWGPRYRCRY